MPLDNKRSPVPPQSGGGGSINDVGRFPVPAIEPPDSYTDIARRPIPLPVPGMEIKPPGMGFVQPPEDGLSATHHNLLNMRGKARISQDNLAARIQQYMKKRVEALHVAAGDHDILVRIDLHSAGV